MLEWKRGGLTQEILDKHFVMHAGIGDYPQPSNTTYRPGNTDVNMWKDTEWYLVLPEIKTPAVPTKVVLEEWMYISKISPSSDVSFKWRPVGGEAVSSWTGWVKTGVTREIEVPNG